MKKKILPFKCFFIFLILSFIIRPLNTYATSTSTPPASANSGYNELSRDKKDYFDSLSCESELVNILTGNFKYTCYTDPLLDYLANIFTTGGQNIAFTIRLRLKDNKLDKARNGCARSNRVPYDRPELPYYLCSNTLIAGQNIGSLFSGSSAPNYQDYHEEFVGTPEFKNSAGNTTSSEVFKVNAGSRSSVGQTGSFVDFGLPTGIVGGNHKVIVDNDKICVGIRSGAVLTGVRNGDGYYSPIGCKYLTEPCLDSAYGQSGCSNLGDCSAKAYRASRVITSLTSKIIYCIKDSIYRLLITQENCPPQGTIKCKALGESLTGATQATSGSSQATSNASPSSRFDELSNSISTNPSILQNSVLRKFQINLTRIVTILLTIYVSLFGFKILLSGAISHKDWIMFVIKIVLVTYFSIGINVGTTKYDGISSIILPFMLDSVTGVAAWFMTPLNGFCSFNQSDYASASDFNTIVLWDSIDCRLLSYLGIDSALEMLFSNNSLFETKINPVPPYVFLLGLGLIIGNADMIAMALSYPILVLSISAYIVALYVSSMILIMILSILGPIFIPMSLFEYTKKYFQSWLQALIGVTLQPIIAVCFMALMYQVYDNAFFGACGYEKSQAKQTTNYSYQTTKNYYTFRMVNNSLSEADRQSCRRSLGYILNAMMGNRIPEGPTDAMPEIEIKQKLFIQSPTAVWSAFIDFLQALIVSFIMLKVMEQLMSVVDGFAAGLTGGIGGSTGAINAANMNAAGNAAAGKAAGTQGGGQNAG